MDFCLIRHGEPDWRPQDRFRRDPELTERGHDQAHRLAERAKGWAPVDEVWVSPALRSQQTAAPILEALGAPTRTLDWLVEVKVPEHLEGKGREELGPYFSGLRERTIDAWWLGLPDGGEPLQDFWARVGGGFDAELGVRGASRTDEEPPWLGLPDDARVVVVSHAGTSTVAACHLMGLNPVPWAWERFRLGHAAMTVLRSASISTGQIFQLDTFNDRLHLPTEMHTI